MMTNESFVRLKETAYTVLGGEHPSSISMEFVETLLRIAEKANNEIMNYHIDWAKLNSYSPDYEQGYKPEFPDVVQELTCLIRILQQRLRL